MGVEWRGQRGRMNVDENLAGGISCETRFLLVRLRRRMMQGWEGRLGSSLFLAGWVGIPI